MNQGRRRSVAVLLATATAAALAYAATPRTKVADLSPPINLSSLFPSVFDGWRLDDSLPVILPAPDVQAKLDAIYNQVLSRTYINAEGQRVMLSVAYGGDQSDGMSIHLPEVCYPAQGFSLVDQRSGVLSLSWRQLPVVQLVTRMGNRSEPVTYWVVVGDAVAAGRIEQKLLKVRYALHGLIPDGMLVRVSSIDVDVPRAFALQTQFIAGLAQHLSPAARLRVFGTV
jgi:EpsI family protein